MRVLIVFFILLMIFLGWFAYLNDDPVTVYFSQKMAYETSVTAVALLSMAFGGLIVIIGIGIRGTKNIVQSWKASRGLRREERVQELLAAGINAFVGGNLKEAVSRFEKSLEIDANHGPTLLRLGNTYRMMKRYGDAIRVHRRAKAVSEGNAEVLLALAKDCEEARREEEAIQTLREILRLDGANLTALTQIRDIHVRLNQWEEAHEIQERLLKAISSDEAQKTELATLIGIKYEVGRLYLNKKDRDKASRYFRGAIKRDRLFVPAHIGLADVLIQEDKSEKAAELLEKSLHITSSLIILHHLEDLYLDLGRPDQIIRIYQEAIQASRGATELKFYLGKLYYRLEMIDEAFEVLDGIDVSHERFPDLHKLLGALYLKKNNVMSALREFRQGLEFKKRIVVPYYCPKCDYHTAVWSGRCPRCDQWNTFDASPVRVETSLPRESVLRLPF